MLKNPFTMIGLWPYIFFLVFELQRTQLCVGWVLLLILIKFILPVG